MERLGTVDRIAQGLLVVTTDTEASVGSEVVDQDLQSIGTLVELFGPVESPYAVVAPVDDADLTSRLGEPVYVR